MRSVGPSVPCLLLLDAHAVEHFAEFHQAVVGARLIVGRFVGEPRPAQALRNAIEKPDVVPVRLVVDGLNDLLLAELKDRSSIHFF